jgi:hypothetical protein
MISVGIGEIQKKPSIFTNITESIQIVDKRKKEILAMVYPVKKSCVISSLSGKYKNKIKNEKIPMEKIKEKSVYMALEEKYGLSS